MEITNAGSSKPKYRCEVALLVPDTVIAIDNVFYLKIDKRGKGLRSVKLFQQPGAYTAILNLKTGTIHYTPSNIIVSVYDVQSEAVLTTDCTKYFKPSHKEEFE